MSPTAWPVAFALLCLGAAQNPEPTARTVRLDAVVTDAGGRPIPNLKVADFEVVENGVGQRIDAVEPPDSGPYVIALLLDEFHVSAGPASARVREAARQFVDSLRAGDRIVVLKPLDSLIDIRMTAERDQARRVIDSFEGRKGNYSALTEFEEKYIGRAPSAVQSARAQIVFSALRALTLKLGEMELGRSAVVLVSDGFAADPARERERRVGDVQGLVRAASRHNVAIYSFRPSQDVMDSSDEPLRSLASETGGESVANGDGLADAFRRVTRDLDNCYLLSYTSSHSGDGRFYDVQVRVKPRNAQVRVRTGYWAPLRADLFRASDSRPAAPARALRRSPLIDTWVGLTIGPNGGHQVTLTWEPVVARNRARAGAAAAAPSIVSLKVTTKAGAVLFEGELRAPRAALGPVREQTAVFDADPGRIQLDLSIRAMDGTQIDTAAQDIDVPDPNRTDPVILAPQVFPAASAREFRDLSGNPYAAPVPARVFRRTDRLLLRIPSYSPSGATIELSARLVNRVGQVLRDIPPMSGNRLPGMTQYDLPLAWLAPGEYTVELSAKTSSGKAKELVRFRVTG